MTWLAWRTLRWHPGGLLGTFITLVVAATTVSAMWFVVDSADRQVVPVERYAGVPLVVGSKGGTISPGLVAAVDALPEVERTVPDLTFPVGLFVRGTRVEVPGDQREAQWGHGWSSARLTPFLLREGRAPRSAGEVVADARLAATARVNVGDRVDVSVAGTVRTHVVVGVAVPRSAWRHQSALFFADRHVAELAGRGRGADALGVYPRPGVGVETLRAAVARAVEPYDLAGPRAVRVAVGAERGRQENNIVVPDGFTTAWFLVWSTALVSTGMIAAAMGLSVRRRGTEIAVLRAVGARPGQIRRMLLAEGVLLAVVATVAAVPLGMLLAPLAADRFRDFGTVNVALEVGYRLLPMVWTFALTLAMAVAASLAAVRRALRIRPGDALGEAPAEGRRLGRVRLLTGLTLLAGAGVLSLAQLSGLTGLGDLGLLFLQFATVFVAVASVGMLAPWAVLVLGGPVRAVVARVSRASGHLAAANVVFNHRRFAGAVGSLTLGATLAGVVMSTQSFYDWRSAARAAAAVRADHVLQTSAGYGALSEELRRRVLDHDGTSAVVGIGAMPIAVSVEGRAPVEDAPQVTATVVTGDITQVVDLSVRGRPPGELGEHEVAITESLAAGQEAGIGTRLRIRLPGTREDTLHTVTTIYAGTGELGQVLLPSAAIAGTYLPTKLYDRLYVRGTGLAEALDPRTAVESVTRQEYVWRKSRASAEANRTTPYLAVLVALFSLVAAVNSLCLALIDRRREITAMRHLGMRRGQAMRMACWESALTIVPVILLALAASAWMAFVHAASEPGGPAAAVSFIPFGWLALLGGGGLIAALAGSLLVVRATMNHEERQGST
ncbi:ABC transporter permease [Nonomuraea deserti]|uniref:ABC transporter permease n=1 Tax=Nonomuraea deserti TaxID=1848322 RepID=A0A4R4VA59_9ACTN|nr:FtsX-like permease family protein [Nonomuraea deserti]TDD01972.1 ABC transporter permease [Nonomuraea deserti]